MKKQHVGLLVGLILAVATPSVLAVGYYLVTGDASIRPLALTREIHARVRAWQVGADIRARVEWGLNAPVRLSQEQLRERITEAFAAHGEQVFVILEETNATTIRVTYEMGRNTFGPLSISQAANGVRPAIDAFRISLRD